MAGSGRRQVRVTGGRRHQLLVRLDDEQWRIVEARAAAAGLGPAAYLAQVGAGGSDGPAGSAGGDGASVAWRRAMVLELGAVLRNLRAAGNNLNQLLRWVHVHEGDLPQGVAGVLAQVGDAVTGVAATAGRLDPGAARRSRPGGSRP